MADSEYARRRIIDHLGIAPDRVVAIHLAAALSLGDDLGAVVTYDDRMAAAATGLGLVVAQPA